MFSIRNREREAYIYEGEYLCRECYSRSEKYVKTLANLHITRATRQGSLEIPVIKCIRCNKEIKFITCMIVQSSGKRYTKLALRRRVIENFRSSKIVFHKNEWINIKKLDVFNEKLAEEARKERTKDILNKQTQLWINKQRESKIENEEYIQCYTCWYRGNIVTEKENWNSYECKQTGCNHCMYKENITEKGFCNPSPFRENVLSEKRNNSLFENKQKLDTFESRQEVESEKERLSSYNLWQQKKEEEDLGKCLENKKVEEVQMTEAQKSSKTVVQEPLKENGTQEEFDLTSFTEYDIEILMSVANTFLRESEHEPETEG